MSSFTLSLILLRKGFSLALEPVYLARLPTRKPQCWDHALLNIGAQSKLVLLPEQQMLLITQPSLNLLIFLGFQSHVGKQMDSHVLQKH